MKKIAFVANTDWYLYNFRFHMMRAMKNLGWNVVAISPKGIYSKKFQEVGIKHIEWEIGRKSINPIMEILSIFKLRQIYKTEQPDIVHHHTNKAVIYGSIAAQFIRHIQIAVVNSIPGIGFIGTRNFMAYCLRPIVFSFFSIISRFSSNKITIFENVKDYEGFCEKRLVNPSNARLILSVGVDLEKYVFSPRKAKEQYLAIYPGRMLWSKGVGLFIEAARTLKHEPRIKFALIGAPDEGNPDSIPESQLLAWEREGIIEYYGWVSDMVDVYRKVDIVVVPTTYGEGVPTVILEACATGNAVIATHWPGCRDIIEHNVTGILIEPYSSEKLIIAIQDLLDNPEKIETLGKAGFLKVSQNFSVQEINAKTLSLYKQVVIEKG